MQVSPHYGPDPIITVETLPDAVAGPAIRQRRRLADALAGFTDEQWAHATRCTGWSGRDVISHLDSTNRFWSASIEAGLRGEPTQFLASFDPVATPAQIVAGSADLPAQAVFERFAASTGALVDLWESLGEADWLRLAEAPPGHLEINAVVHHALWDSWVHERDILLPLGLTPDEEADEIVAALRYVATLGPALAITRGSGLDGRLAVEGADPEVSLVVEIGQRVVVYDGEGVADLRLQGGSVELLEALSIRQPLPHAVPDEWAWMVQGLATIFEVGPTPQP